MNKIKYIGIALAFLLFSYSADAQYVQNAIRFAQNHYEGTARSAAMGNAFTGLGGELGAMNINPAAIGLYKYMEFSITPAIGSTFNESAYLGSLSKSSRTTFGLSNFGVVVPVFRKGSNFGLSHLNIGVAYNKTHDMNYSSINRGLNQESSWLSNQAAAANGTDNSWLGFDDDYNPFYEPGLNWTSISLWNTYLLDPFSGSTDYIAATDNVSGSGRPYLAGDLMQTFAMERRGSKDQVDINFSGNVSDIFYFGLNVGIMNISYRQFQRITEEAVNPQLFTTGFKSYTVTHDVATSGSGVNLNFGVIVRPVYWFSIGASISTPTWYYLSETYEVAAVSRFGNGHDKPTLNEIASPLGTYSYRINTPFRWNVGASAVIAKRLAISFDYENTNYGSTRLIDSYDMAEFEKENDIIRANYKSVNNFRAGLEFKATRNLALRLGYNYYDFYDKEKAYNDMHVIAGGLGYIFNNGIFLDATYQHYMNKDFSYSYYTPVNGAPTPIANDRDWRFKVLLTIGYRF